MSQEQFPAKGRVLETEFGARSARNQQSNKCVGMDRVQVCALQQMDKEAQADT